METLAQRRPNNKFKKQKRSTKPIKVVYISNPMRVKTTASKFRALVQELTGRYSNVADCSFKFSDDDDSLSTSDIDGVHAVPNHRQMAIEETSIDHYHVNSSEQQEVPRVGTSPCDSLPSSSTTTTLTCSPSSTTGAHSSLMQDYDFEEFLQQLGEDLQDGMFVPQMAAENLNVFFPATAKSGNLLYDQVVAPPVLPPFLL